MKTDRISTDQGVQLAVVDAERGTLLWKPETSITASRPWTQIVGKFAIPPGGILARIALVRNVSAKIDSKIKGTVWLDDVEVVPTVDR
jgi:hypothetical protein